MRTPRLFAALFLVAAWVLPASGQIVHLSATNASIWGILYADSAQSLLDRFSWTGPVQFDLYYDASTPGSSPDNPPPYYYYTFSDPSRNFWRAKFTIDNLGTFVVTQPLRGLLLFDNGLFASGVQSGQPWELSLAFASSIPVNALPLPPFPTLNHDELNSLNLDGSFFAIPHVLEERMEITFDQFTSEIQPVPEPATYALAGLLVAAIVIVRRRVTARA
jgi:hypothetical protein